MTQEFGIFLSESGNLEVRSPVFSSKNENWRFYQSNLVMAANYYGFKHVFIVGTCIPGGGVRTKSRMNFIQMV